MSHVIELEHHGDGGARASCRSCGLLGDTSERIAGGLIARHRALFVTHPAGPWWNR